MIGTVTSLKLAEKSETDNLSVVREATALEEQAVTLVIEVDADVLAATNLLSVIAKAKKELESQRTFIVKPINDQVKAINDRFKTYQMPLDRADRTLRQKVMTYRQVQDKKRREEEERLQALAAKEQARFAKQAAKKGLPEPPPPPVAHIEGPTKTVQAELGTASVKKVWDFEIIDESQIPREYLMVDTKKIGAVVKAGIRNIPGVRIFESEQLAVRAR